MINLKSTPCILGWILLAGLFLRCAILTVFDGEKLEIVDEIHYNALAVELVQSGLYANPGEGLVSLRPPLYPWFISKIYELFGLENYTAVRIFQVFLALLTTLMVYGLAREWEGILTQRGALWVTGVFCFYPSLIVENFLLLTETLFTFWLVLVLWTASRFLRTGSPYSAAFCGVFIAFGALTRSILWLSPIPLSLFFMIFARQECMWKKRISGALLLLLFAGVGMTPWIVRNTRIQKTFTPIDCMSGRNLMMGNYEFTPFYRAWDAISATPPTDWYTVLREKVREEKNVSLDSLTQGQKDRLASAYAKDFILENPGLTLQRNAMKALCFWQLERSTLAGVAQGFWGLNQFQSNILLFITIATVILVPYVSIFLLAVLGICIFRYRSANLPATALMLAILLYFWLLHSLAFAHERYHLPLIPILILFAVYAVENFHPTWQWFHQNRRHLLVFGIIASIFIVFWTCEISWIVFQNDYPNRVNVSFNW